MGTRRRQWCDGCNREKPQTGFRAALCGDCFCGHLRGQPLDALVAALHLAYRDLDPAARRRLNWRLKIPA